ncbi:DegV family protein [Nocardioides sp. AE5]|uniref:DegV family protein n=1 Tax=Nocardioides sp. AE5 TaxID=2962573 RepID=UPI0028825282|nr:DegV family protein [Nocardioides sp. AE5]MDT0201063.1 DegV family protein [Nocardioides sp. AE5]
MTDGRIVVVTDSTASLPADVVEASDVVVIPLQVVIGANSYSEGVDDGASPAMVAAALKEFTPVSTSRPSHTVMLEVYESLAAEGATEIISIHLSGEMSGTFDSAYVASGQAPVPVYAVDSRQVGPATGYAVRAALQALADGATAAEAAEAARERAEASSSLFYVDTLEYLRRGGRVGGLAALLGGALAVKPLLRIEDGKIDSFEKVRTAGKALGRLEDLAVEAAADEPVEVTVAHLASPARADQLATRLTARLDLVAPVRTTELGAVLGAHVGPGMVAVCVAPALAVDVEQRSLEAARESEGEEPDGPGDAEESAPA